MLQQLVGRTEWIVLNRPSGICPPKPPRLPAPRVCPRRNITLQGIDGKNPQVRLQRSLEEWV